MKKESFGIVLILLLAFALRATGFLFGLPQVMHQDEPIIINHALAYASFDFNPHFFKIPPLLSYLVFAVYGGVFVVLHFLRGISTDDFALWFFKDPTFFYGVARFLFGVAMGTASVGVLYGIGKRLFGKTAALWAAALFAVNYLHVRDSHYVYADIPMLFSMLMVFWHLTRYRKDGKNGDFLWSAAWVGVATAFKYIAAPVMLPVFQAAFFMREGRAKRMVASASLAAAVYAVLNPFSLLNFRFFWDEMHQQAAAEAAPGLWHHGVYSLVGSFGWVSLIAGAAMVFFLVKFSRERWIWAFPVLYYLGISFFSQHYERYAMPAVPFLCLAFGNLLGYLEKRKATMFLVGLLVAATPLAKSVYLDGLLLKTDTRTEARRWIESHIPEGSTIAIDHAFFSPNLAQTPEQINEKKRLVEEEDEHGSFKIKRFDLVNRAQSDRTHYRVFYVDQHNTGSPKFISWSPIISGDPAEFKKERVQYLVRFRHHAERDYFEKNSFKDLIKKKMAVFSPYDSPKKIITQDKWANAALPFQSDELFSRIATGPYLELYELKVVAA